MPIHLDDYPYENWMTNLPDALANLPVNNLSIPGTHDSFAFSIDSSSKVAPDADPAFRKIAAILGKLGRWAIAKWAKTQSLTFEQQLKSGIRYFDLRVAPNSNDKDRFYYVHGLFAGNVADSLRLMDKFLTDHPKEILLLDFNHFYAMNNDQHRALIALIKGIFKSKLATFQNDPPSLNVLRSRKQQVFIFYHNSLGTSHLASFWPGYYIPSPWANTADVNKMIEYLDATYLTARRPNWFLVCQGILTPTTSTILKNVFAGIKNALANKATPAFVGWLEDKTTGTSNGINACIVDFAEDFDYISQVLAINMRKLNANGEIL